MVRTRVRPHCAWKSLWLLPLFLGLSIAAATDGSWIVCAILSLITAFMLARPLKESAIAINTVKAVVKSWEEEVDSEMAVHTASPELGHKTEEAALES